MQTKPAKPFLFIHVMKTGGTSFAEIIRRNFPRDARYPDANLAPNAIMAQSMEAYLHVPKLLRCTNRAGNGLQIVSGHIPYAVRNLLNADYTAITLLRDPLSRTISYLKHCRKYHVEHQGMELEAIYDQRWFFETFIHNYQTKLFSMSSREVLAETRLGDMHPPLPARADFVEGAPPPAEARQLQEVGHARLALELFSASTGVIQANEQRLDTARKNLARVELVGTTECYEQFLLQLSTAYGWDVSAPPHRNAGDDRDVSPELKRRIEQDNQLDQALYEYALTLSP